MQNRSSKPERCEILARYLVEESSTVRATAERFGVSKSTVHKDLTEKLKYADMRLYEAAAEILKKNKLERHIRGGIATKIKYQNIRNIKNISDKDREGPGRTDNKRT